MAGVSHLTPVHLGLDVHKDTISVAILAPDRDGPDVERITHDEVSVRRLVGGLGDPRWLRACYEAGPTGYDLARLLHTRGVRCEVIAPSLIPKAPGDRVKTDKRDCRRLARLHRAGELVAIRIPSIEEEAVRDCAGPAGSPGRPPTTEGRRRNGLRQIYPKATKHPRQPGAKRRHGRPTADPMLLAEAALERDAELLPEPLPSTGRSRHRRDVGHQHCLAH